MATLDADLKLLQPNLLLLLEREEEPRDLRKRIDTLLAASNPEQLELLPNYQGSSGTRKQLRSLEG